MRATSRREVLKLGVAALTAASLKPSGIAQAADAPGITSTRALSSAATRNRAPLQASAFYPLPTGAIKPEGWLRDQMLIQANGLGGHLDETWPDVGPNSGWLGGTGESWERGPYFLDGLIPLAWQLDDARLKAKAMKFIEWTLTHAQPGGQFGPTSNQDWWPRMVMLKALTQYQEATSDARVIPMMERYFAYQLSALPERPLSDWGRYRWQDEVFTVLWLYNRNGDEKLLQLARLLKQQGYDWQAQFADFHFTEPCTAAYLGIAQGGNNDRAMQTHGVNNAQALKASPLSYLLTGAKDDRAGMAQQLAMLDKYHGLPNGIFSADEHLGGREPSHGTELCTVVETMFSLELALGILGDSSIGDRLEQIAFNALPAAFTDDMWAHQYNQQPNQVQVSLNSKPWTTDGPESNLFGLEPHFGCCTANFHQGWPKLTASLWMLSHDDGLAAVAYAPCRSRTVVRGVPVDVLEETEYPFRDTIRVTVSPTSPISFPLHLRIPAWAEGATLAINGSDVTVEPGSFARVERTWNAGDRVELKLPLKARTIRGYRDSVSVERGPLVFSYPIGENWLKLRDRGMTADWQIYPSTQWNYALAARTPADHWKVKEAPVTKSPFALASTPIGLEAEAIRLPGCMRRTVSPHLRRRAQCHCTKHSQTSRQTPKSLCGTRPSHSFLTRPRSCALPRSRKLPRSSEAGPANR